jgi:hypothetical protein
MTRLLCTTAIGGALLLCGVASGANAATVTIGSELAYSGSNDAPLYFVVAPDASTPLFTPAVTGSIDGVQRSPYQTNSGSAPTTQPYSVLSPGGQASPGSSATYNLGGATNFTILWGSPDDYNFITFYSGALGTGSVLSTSGVNLVNFTGLDAACYVSTCDRLAWDLVTFNSSAAIGSVVLSDSGQAAFEYGLSPIGTALPTPLPAAVWLFGTVIAGAAGASRLRRQRKAA